MVADPSDTVFAMSSSDLNNCPVDICGWRRLQSRTVYENRWISVHHQDVIAPSGAPGIYGLVHFKGLAVGVIPIDAEEHTYLVRQSRYTLGHSTWEIPEGGAAPGETGEACAARELEEECGVRAGRISELMRVHTSNSVTDELGIIYLAQDLQAGEQQLDASEDIEVRRLPLRQAVQMALSGEITDAMSVAGLLKVALLRGVAP